MGKRGPQPKGQRRQITTALPVEIISTVEGIAADEGSDRTAVVTRLLAERLGLPVPHYCLPPGAQEELPLTQAS